MKQLAKTCQKESALGKYLYWALEKRKKNKKLSLKKMFSENYPETYFGSGIVSVPWDAMYVIELSKCELNHESGCPNNLGYSKTTEPRKQGWSLSLHLIVALIYLKLFVNHTDKNW